MSALVFGAAEPTPDEQKKLDLFDASLRSLLIRSKVYNISAITPTSGILDTFINLDALSAHGVVYSTSYFATKAGEGYPTDESMKCFMLEHGITNFSWDNAMNAALLAADQSRVYGRCMMVVHYCVDACRQVSVTSEVEDLPLSSAQQESCEDRYKQLYGEQVDASQLGSVMLLGKLSRGMATRSLPAIQLSAVFAQDDDRARVEDSHLDPSTMRITKKQKTVRIPTIPVFLEKLEILMLSYVFVSTLSLAPFPKWAGGQDEGVLKGARIQLTRQGAMPYIAYWKEQAKNPHATVDKLIGLEARVRKSWTDPFRKFTQLQSCVRLSITEFRGEIRASLVPKQFSPPHRQQGGGGKQGGGPPQPGFAAKDFSKIPGFDPEIQTVKNDAGGKGICKQYQVGKCAFGAKCRWAHVCDVMMEGNQACGASHTRQGHFAATGNKGKGRGSGPPPPPAEQETG